MKAYCGVVLRIIFDNMLREMGINFSFLSMSFIKKFVAIIDNNSHNFALLNPHLNLITADNLSECSCKYQNEPKCSFIKIIKQIFPPFHSW